MQHHIIFGNYGNETIGLIQWAAEQRLTNVAVVSVDTKWSASVWRQRVEQGEALARANDFAIVRLTAQSGFAELVKTQANFPSTQYQWCAGFLKALPFIDWLDKVDPTCAAFLILGNRRGLARQQGTLPEFIAESEYFGERKIWHPLYLHDDSALRGLVSASGLAWLPHRSLECDPCVNNSPADFLRLHAIDTKKTAQLEQQLRRPMFAPASYGESAGIESVIHWLEKNPKSATLRAIDMGCGSPFACGL